MNGEVCYLELVENIICKGIQKKNRTGIDTIGISSAMIKHDMSKGFPLLTTKKMSIKNIAIELEFFIKGLTDKRWLQERGCHIWDEWCNPTKVKYGTDEDTKQKMKDESDLGPIYGSQLRNFNGVDQLINILTTLSINPNDRRMVASYWNPNDLYKMALPPCHLMWNLVVINGTLNLNWYQRSCDVMLGFPYDLASYGLLLILLANEVDMIPGILTGFIGDTHIYINHIEQAHEQIKRLPKILPSIKLLYPDKTIFNWTYEDIQLENYNYHPALKFNIAI